MPTEPPLVVARVPPGWEEPEIGRHVAMWRDLRPAGQADPAGQATHH